MPEIQRSGLLHTGSITTVAITTLVLQLPALSPIAEIEVKVRKLTSAHHWLALLPRMIEVDHVEDLFRQSGHINSQGDGDQDVQMLAQGGVLRNWQVTGIEAGERVAVRLLQRV